MMNIVEHLALSAIFTAQKHIEELGILAGAMDIDITDGRPMDIAMTSLWESAFSNAEGMDAVARFCHEWMTGLNPPDEDFRVFVSEICDASSETRKEAEAIRHRS